jgi:pyruvate kinase
VRRTKIVATAGPAWDRPGVLDAMVSAGVDVARLNASHASRDELAQRLHEIREASHRAGRHIGIMLDLGGPKVRAGEVADGTRLVAGDPFALVASSAVGDSLQVTVNYPGLASDVSAGDRILLDDGAIELAVTGTSEGRVDTTVIVGGPLASHKGVNIPGVRLGMDSVTDKDLDDARWAVGAGVDWLAQSFVRGPEDIDRLRASMGDAALPIVAKVEKHEALDGLEGIVDAADAIMVARGDLGVETSPEQVPVVQRRLVNMCRQAGKPVVVATQMLESMRSSPRPTRAEASDVATAVFERADAVMLSAESAIGDYPVEAAETMARICVTAEESMTGRPPPRPKAADDVTSAVSSAACDLAADVGAAAIVTATESGTTARAVAAGRPDVPVVAVTPEERVADMLALVWGVLPVVVSPFSSLEEMASRAAEQVRRLHLAGAGDTVVLTAGVALNRPGTTDMIRVLAV